MTLCVYPFIVYVGDVLDIFNADLEQSLLVMVPVRLGSESLNPIYIPCVKVKWMYGRINRQMNGWMDGWENKWTDEWMDGWTDKWTDEWMDGWTDKWTDEWMDGWTDKWTDEYC